MGLVLPQYETSWDMVHQLALAAESAGFASIWLEDHFNPWAGTPTGSAFEGWVALSALAQVTSRIQLGTLCTCASYRYPTLVAKMGATLDVVSQGRFILGIGAGWYADEYDAYGIPFPAAGERVGRLAEAVQIIRAMWTDSAPSFAGKYYSVHDAVCNPRPTQQPHPPIWIGGGGPRIMRIAAKYADGWNYGALTAEQFHEKLQKLHRYAAKAKRTPGSLTASLELFVFLGRTEGEVRERVRKFEAARPSGQGMRHLIRDAYFVTRVEGTPEECVERLSAYADAGVTHFTLVFPEPDAETIGLFGEQVIPQLLP